MQEEQFGPYRLVRLIGRGGMGEVFEAHDIEQDRTVALKRLLPHMVSDPEFQKRFRRESRLAARLRSPHVIPIHRSGEIDGQLFIDMRLVDGYDLQQLLTAEGSLAPSRAVAIVEQVGSALDAAHHAGLIHRDIKPSNVLLDTAVGAHEFVYLVDFGITRAMGGESQSLTSTHAVLGSLDYMAPEQFDGIAGREIDIYSLGCLLFQCLTGSRPFPVEGFPALMRAHLTRPAPLPSHSHPELGSDFDEVIARALAKDPAERYPSAGELGAAARDALTGAARAGSAVDVPLAPRPGAHPSSPGDRSGGDTEPSSPARVPTGSSSAAARRGRTSIAAANPVAGPSSTPLPEVARPREPAESDTPAEPAAHAGSGRRGVGLLGAATAPTASRPRVDQPHAESAAAEAEQPWSRNEDRIDDRNGSTPEEPAEAPPAPPPEAPASPGAGEGPWSGRGRRRGLLLGAAALALVAVLAVGTVVGTKLVSGGDPGPLEAIPLAPAGPMLRSVDTPTVATVFSVGNAPEALAVSPDGRRAYVTGAGGANVVNVVDTAHGSVLATVPAPGPPQFIALDPAGRRGYVTLYDPAKDQNAVAVLDLGANAFTAVIPTGQKRPFGLAVSPDGKTVYVPNHDSGDVTVIDTAAARVTTQIQVPESPHWIAFSPTGRIAYAANHHSGVVTVLDTKTNTVAGVIPIGNMVSPHSIAVMPDGRRAMVTNYDGNTVSTIDTATNQVLSTMPVGINPQSIAFARDGRHAYVVNNGTNNLNVINTETGKITATLPLGTSPWMVAVSPDGRFAYATSKETNALTVLSIAN